MTQFNVQQTPLKQGRLNGNPPKKAQGNVKGNETPVETKIYLQTSVSSINFTSVLSPQIKRTKNFKSRSNTPINDLKPLINWNYLIFYRAELKSLKALFSA